MSDGTMWKPCTCLETYQRELEAMNTRIETGLILNMETQEKTVRVAIQTRKLDSRSKKRAELMIASFCPLCGNAYTEKAHRVREERIAAGAYPS